jgi:imidazole glycerol-phosphate synthase subunit HisH
MIAIIDYGMGNIHSVRKAMEFMGAETLVARDPADIRSARKLVLPGVGAFDDAMQELEKMGLIPVIKEEIKKKKPFLGICLGMQLLFERSREAKTEKGLGVLRGSVEKFSLPAGMKVPHMGWNQLSLKKKECPLFAGITDSPNVYFCHSYYPQPEDDGVTAATCDYGGEFSCAVWQGTVYGVQFHPEKSQETGLRIIENFVKLC